MPLLRLILALLALAAPASAEEAATHRLDAICALGAEASQGCAAIRAREPLDAALPPWSAIGRVNFASTDVLSHCTGALVSRRTVLTAAHCLWNGARRRPIPAESLRFAAAYQKGEARALARITRIVTSPALDLSRPAFRVSPPDDWALLILDSPLGESLGHFPLFQGRLRLAGPGMALMPGYAGLTPHALTLARDCGQPLAVAGRLMAACSAMPGDSGAPLLWRGESGLALLGTLAAVHAAPGAFTTDFAPWFRFRAALDAEIAAGN